MKLIVKTNKQKLQKLILIIIVIILLVSCTIQPIFAQGDVAGVIQSTWEQAENQIKQVINNVVFPALDLVLVIAFFLKLGVAYFDYKRNNERFEWTAPAILFVCLIFTLTAPSYIWSLI